MFMACKEISVTEFYLQTFHLNHISSIQHDTLMQLDGRWCGLDSPVNVALLPSSCQLKVDKIFFGNSSSNILAIKARRIKLFNVWIEFMAC
jgi:hypothetical protein